MTIIQAKSENDLTLGRQGENLARQVVFDLSAWEAEYGPGTVELIHQRPGDTSPYPVAAVREGSTLVWTLTATDTAVASSYGSDGRCELRYYVGEVLVKSRTWLTKVIRAMSTPSETAPPEPEQGWVDQVVAVGAAAKASADAAKADADRAAALAAEVSKKAAQTAKDAVQSAQAKEAAQTAQRLAEEAQGAAEAARTAAETAQAAAEQSATDAAGAKQDAETAQKAAQDAAAAAAKALEDIRALYQQMQTWAQGVIQDVNAAGSAAVQSVQSAGDAQVQRVTAEGAAQTANAKAQADAAAQSASGAAQSAQQAAESAAVYDTVVADVTQLKQDVVAITPDDTTVDGKPWTSKKIVDSLCQPFEESGNPVQCYPVENYPLGVKVQIEPTQDGSGDPSPDNIRPITGRNSVSVTRCGKNLLEYPYVDTTKTANGIQFSDFGDGRIGVKGTATANAFFFIANQFDYKISLSKNYPYAVLPNGMVISATGLVEGCTIIRPTDNNRIYIRVEIGATVDTVITVQYEVGTTPTAYEPYRGNTYNIALPETVYGGTLDVETGVVTVRNRVLIPDGTTIKFGELNGRYWNLPNGLANGGAPSVVGADIICSHYYGRFGLNASNGTLFTRKDVMADLYETVDDFNTYVANQYASGTPLQLMYTLAEPYTIQLTPQQIAALSGVNTIYTDADGVVVTGAEDPKHTITELKNAIISLGGNV